MRVPNQLGLSVDKDGNQYAREPVFWKVALFSQDMSRGITDLKLTRNTKLILDHTPFQF